MERVELRTYGDQIHLYIDEKFCAAMGIGTMKRYGPHPGEVTDLPAVFAYDVPYAPMADTPVTRAPMLFEDAAKDVRAETEAWRDTLIARMRQILDPNYYNMPSGSYYENDRIEAALSSAAKAFGGHFPGFLELLCAWMVSRPLGEPRAVDTTPLAPGEPPPGVQP